MVFQSFKDLRKPFVYGEKIYYKLNSGSKFANKSSKGYFVGYDELNRKAYRIYVPGKKRIIVSDNIKPVVKQHVHSYVNPFYEHSNIQF